MQLRRHPLSTLAVASRIADLPVDRAIAARLRRTLDGLPAATLDRELARLCPPRAAAVYRAVLAAVVGGLDDPDRLRAALHVLGAQAGAEGLRRADYLSLNPLILQALAAAAGEDWSAEADADWSRALALIAEILLEGAGRAESPPRGPK